MDVEEMLDQLLIKARKDEGLREILLATRTSPEPVSEFCKEAHAAGYPISVMDLIDLGESTYAAMKRSTNGGGENSPLLEGQNDEYTLFLAKIEHIK